MTERDDSDRTGARQWRPQNYTTSLDATLAWCAAALHAHAQAAAGPEEVEEQAERSEETP